MKREVLSGREFIATITLFIMGSTFVMGVGTQAGRNIWISIFFAIIMIIPLIAIYIRILQLHPDKTFYEIIDVVMGKFFGKIIILLFSYYAFFLGELVLNNFSKFIKIVGLPETPELVPALLLGVVCIWAVKAGFEVIGRWSKFSLSFLMVILLTVSVLAMNEGNIENIRPMLYDGLMPVLNNAFSVFSFPFAEICLFLTVMRYTKSHYNPKRIFYSALALGGFFVLMIALRSVFILGEHLTRQFYYASYTTIGLIEVGRFIQRIEASVAIVFIYGGVVKISVCILAAAKGFDNVFKIGDYRKIVAPITLLMIIMSYFIFENVKDMFDWAGNIYPYFAFPFQVIIPVIVWIAAEIKVRKQKGKQNAN